MPKNLQKDYSHQRASVAQPFLTFIIADYSLIQLLKLVNGTPKKLMGWARGRGVGDDEQGER